MTAFVSVARPALTPTKTPLRTVGRRQKRYVHHTAKVKIELKVGASKITITPANITIDSPTITFKAAGLFTIQGLPIKIN